MKPNEYQLNLAHEDTKIKYTKDEFSFCRNMWKAKLRPRAISSPTALPSPRRPADFPHFGVEYERVILRYLWYSISMHLPFMTRSDHSQSLTDVEASAEFQRAAQRFHEVVEEVVDFHAGLAPRHSFKHDINIQLSGVQICIWGTGKSCGSQGGAPRREQRK